MISTKNDFPSCIHYQIVDRTPYYCYYIIIWEQKPLLTPLYLKLGCIWEWILIQD